MEWSFQIPRDADDSFSFKTAAEAAVNNQKILFGQVYFIYLFWPCAGELWAIPSREWHGTGTTAVRWFNLLDR